MCVLLWGSPLQKLQAPLRQSAPVPTIENKQGESHNSEEKKHRSKEITQTETINDQNITF